MKAGCIMRLKKISSAEAKQLLRDVTSSCVEGNFCFCTVPTFIFSGCMFITSRQSFDQYIELSNGE